MKTFLYLYPQDNIFEWELTKGAMLHIPRDKSPEFLEKFKALPPKEQDALRDQMLCSLTDQFKPIYKKILNACIEERYRQEGYQVVFAVFDETPVSPIIEVKSKDKVISVGIKSHEPQNPGESYRYPNPDYILNQILPTEHLRVSGHHMWDCVQRVAKHSFEKGIDTLVDEDLTEFFIGRMNNPQFRTNTYPSVKIEKSMQEMFSRSRKNKPWLLQNYN